MITTTVPRAPSTRAFARHYLEMVVAMVLGMVLLEPLWSLVLPTLGASGVLERPDLHALLMATDMTVAMTLWMRYRGHSWRPTAEMAAAMYLPFVVLFVPFWAGVLSGATLFVLGHVLMLAAMAAAMLLRRDEYTRHHQ